MKLTVTTTINKNIKTIWDAFTLPQHITNWYFASTDWHAPFAENDLQVGGRFKIRMEAKDGSFGFDFSGTYSNVVLNKQLDYTLYDKRLVSVSFKEGNNQTIVTQVFEPETENTRELQQQGWQLILDNFKSYTESL